MLSMIDNNFLLWGGLRFHFVKVRKGLTAD
jgi:hypothetical protein